MAFSPERKAKIAASKLGKPLSFEHRAAIAEGQRRRWATKTEEEKMKAAKRLNTARRKKQPSMIVIDATELAERLQKGWVIATEVGKGGELQDGRIVLKRQEAKP